MTDCPICGSVMERIGGWNEQGEPAKYSTWMCPRCHLVVSEPIPIPTHATGGTDVGSST